MSNSPQETPPHSWINGAIIGAIGALIGLASLAWFCSALGLNFSDEGWAGDNPENWKANRTALIGSCLGFVIAVLVFWIGFFQTTDRR